MISFFPVREIPLRSISFSLIFPAPNWSDLSDFCINSMTGSRYTIFQNLSRRNFFRRVVREKNVNFRIFLEGKG